MGTRGMARWTRVVMRFMLLSVAAGYPVGLAQDATPTLPASSGEVDALGYTELYVQVSDSGFLVPGQVTAGRTLITLENTSADSRHSTLLRLPDSLTLQDLFADMGGDAPPAWYFSSTFVGFPGEVLPGERTRAVVDLTPGLYLIVDDTVAPFVVVPAEEAAEAPDPDARATVTLSEFAFAIPDGLTAGPQVWRVENPGAQPHELLLASAPSGTTVDDVLAVFAADETASPIPGGLTFDDLTPVGGIGALSSGGVGWAVLDLAPGTYVALCFVFDLEAMAPHAFMGMVEVFTVGEIA